MTLQHPDPYPQPGDDVPGAPPPLRGTLDPDPPSGASPILPPAAPGIPAGSYGGRIAAGAVAALAVLAGVAAVRWYRRRRG